MHPLLLATMLLQLLLAAPAAGAWRPRDVVIRGGQFVNRRTGAVEVLNGTNIVVKGAPWIPDVAGDSRCHHGLSCTTFNDNDALYVKQLYGEHPSIRLGVIWAGGQPTPEPVLDPKFVARLRAFLKLCEKHEIRVMLDVHQDAVGTAMCGEGVPMWFTRKYFPQRLGKPIIGPKSTANGTCSTADTASWALFAGDPLYNLKNPCCLPWNKPGQSGEDISVTDFSLLQIEQLIGTAAGRGAYATYIRLLAEAVADHPNAITIELMNEPPTIDEANLYRMYQESYEAVRAAGADDIGIGVADTGSGAVYASDDHLPSKTKAWLRSTDHLFYAWHCYSSICNETTSIRNALALSTAWGAGTYLTEFGGCASPHNPRCIGQAAADAGIGSTFYSYNAYCNVPNNATCMPGEPCAFGACIT